MGGLGRTSGYALVAIGACIAASSATGAGYYIREQSTAAMGTGFAGSASRGDNSSFLFYNPATIILNRGMDVTGDVRLFIPSVKIEGSTATRPAFPGPGAPVTGNSGTGEMAEPVLAPSVFASYPLTENLSIGIGASSPFAISLDIEDPWIGRFQLTHISMQAYNVNPVVAYRLNDMVSVGVGLQIQYFEADLRNQSTFLPPPVFGPGEVGGVLKGDDVGFGFTAGFVFQPSERTTLGVGYRSRIEHELEGTASIDPALAPAQGISVDVTSPDIVTASLSHWFSDTLQFHATVEWVNWSLFKDITVEFDSGSPDDERPQNWRDTYSGFAGLSYVLNDATTLNFGGGFTTSANDGTGGSILPDGDRVTLGIGIAHRMTDTWTVNASYSHLFFADTTLTPSSITQGSFVGKTDIDAHVLGVSLTGNW